MHITNTSNESNVGFPQKRRKSRAERPACACRLFGSLGLDHARIETVDEQGDGRLTFIVRDQPCHDCAGTGKYLGLSTVEFCRTCDGSGSV